MEALYLFLSLVYLLDYNSCFYCSSQDGNVTLRLRDHINELTKRVGMIKNRLSEEEFERFLKILDEHPHLLVARNPKGPSTHITYVVPIECFVPSELQAALAKTLGIDNWEGVIKSFPKMGQAIQLSGIPKGSNSAYSLPYS